MAEKKMTKAMLFNEMLKLDEVKANPDYVALLEKTIEQLNRKNTSTGEKKLTKNQTANIELCEKFFSVMCETGGIRTATEWHKVCDPEAEYTFNKFNALLKKLVDSNKVVRTEEKGKAFFRIA